MQVLAVYLLQPENKWFRLDLSLDTDNNPATVNASCNWLDGSEIIVTTDTGVLTFLDTDISKAGLEWWSVDVIKTGALIADGPDADALPDAFVMTDQMGNAVAVELMWKVMDSSNVIATFFTTTLKDGLNNDIFFYGVLKDTNNDNQPDRLEGSWGSDYIDGPLSLSDTNNDGQPDQWQLIRYDAYSGRVQGDSSGNPAGIYFDMSKGFGEDSFSLYGKVTTDFGDRDHGNSVVMQSDGKILVAGYASIGSSDDFALARYNADGTLDTMFSDDGKEVTDFGGDDYGESVVMQSDGKILVAGYASIGSSNDFALARYNADGTLDTTFSGDGKVTTDFGGYDHGLSVVMQSDGKIIVAGFASSGNIYDFALARYNTDGSLDTTFSDDGKVTTDFAGIGYSVVIQGDGKIIVAGSTFNDSSYDFALARYNSDGSLDTTFSGDGKVSTDFGGGDDHGQSVVMQPDGKIIVAGFAFNGSGDFVIARYNADGSLDTTFSDDGKVVTDFGGDDYGESMVMQPDGKIVVAGASDNVSSDGFALARFNSDGSLDTISDITPPMVLTVTPADGATAVAAGNNIVLTFSEAIQKGTGLIEIHSGSATGSVVESYDVATSTNLTVSGSTLTINPTTDLSNGTHYFVTFAPSSVKDLAGNSYSGTNTYDFTTATPTSVHDISGSLTFWKTSAAIADVTSTLTSDSMITGADGLYQHPGMPDGTYALTSAKVSGTSESNAIKANDALAALKIAVGMNPNADGSPVSSYQFLAADVNHDGQVKAADALNILKMAVKLSTAPEKEWLFVPESVGSETMSRTYVVWPDNPIPVTLDVDQELHLIGIVKGDVNGSWVA